MAAPGDSRGQQEMGTPLRSQIEEGSIGWKGAAMALVPIKTASETGYCDCIHGCSNSQWLELRENVGAAFRLSHLKEL
jgi:hypothetical protein